MKEYRSRWTRNREITEREKRNHEALIKDRGWTHVVTIEERG